ncbi:MAG: hypothetical protein JSR19_12700 [Proteobacteria bacterium]|nr:hypothetical protein [Pseudomonadota bacterium]HQR04062.1 hypothetical protein [Rhodocyclaceae bacterium]
MRRPLRGYRGQATVEYLVVLSFGVILLMQGGANAPFKQLGQAIKDYHQHTTHALSIAYIPDCNYQFALDKSSTLQTISDMTGITSVGFDRCVDWTNPQFPALNIGGVSSTLGVMTNIQSYIQDKITNTITGAISDFVNPASLLNDMLGFKPSDFF